MSPRRPHDGEDGFTLLELLVSLGLLGLTVSWLVQAAPLAIRASGVIARIEEGEARRAVEVNFRLAFERAVPLSLFD